MLPPAGNITVDVNSYSALVTSGHACVQALRVWVIGGQGRLINETAARRRQWGPGAGTAPWIRDRYQYCGPIDRELIERCDGVPLQCPSLRGDVHAVYVGREKAAHYYGPARTWSTL